MKEWLNAQELAAEALPGLPVTKRGVNDVAERENWAEHPTFVRKRAGRGGGLEYHFRILPTLAQVAYQQKHLRVGSVVMPAAANDDPAGAAAPNGRAALERDARLKVIASFETFRKGLSLRQASALKVFCDKYNARSLHVDAWVLERVPRISPRSLERWRSAKAAAKDRTPSIGCDRAAARKGKGVLDVAENGKVRLTILAALADNQHFTAEHIRDLVESEYGKTLTVRSGGSERSVPLPPIRTFQHHLKALRNDQAVVLMRVQNPDQFRSTMAPRGSGTLAHVTQANQLWQIDASPVDALCTDGRHAVYVCLDIATRRMILFVSRTPRASAVALMIRKAILAWGVPDLIKTDNGSDFTARDTQRLFASLGVDVELSDPYQPQQKGHVERAIGDFQKDCATMLPGFVGHSVADRKAIEQRKAFADRLGTSDEDAFGVALTGEQLQAEIDRWAATREHERHGTLGMTPFQAAQASTRKPKHVERAGAGPPLDDRARRRHPPRDGARHPGRR